MIEEQSFGIIPLRRKENRWQVFLVKLKSGGHWGFPKGHRENDEKTVIETATRELKEETDLDIEKIFSKEVLFNEIYFLGKVRKEVVYFPALVKGDFSIQKEEILDGKWVFIEEAGDIITYNQSKEVCLQVQKFLKEGVNIDDIKIDV